MQLTGSDNLSRDQFYMESLHSEIKRSIIRHPDLMRINPGSSPIASSESELKVIQTGGVYSEIIETDSSRKLITIVPIVAKHNSCIECHAEVNQHDFRLGDVFGAFVLESSLERVDRDIAESRNVVFLSVSAILIISICLLLILTTRLTKPIVALTSRVKSIAGGNYVISNNLTVDSDGSDEIGILESSFHSMTVNLKTSQEKLLLYSQNLENTVEELRRSKEESELLADQLRQASKMEAIGRLAGGVAHDFNNLLTVIMGNAQLALAATKPNDALYEDLTGIDEAAERAANLTRQLLAFSRKQKLEPKVMNLNQIILNLHEMLKRMLGEDAILESELDDQLRNVQVDPGQIDQVVVNLAVNARDAMPQGGKITFQTQNVVLDKEFVCEHVGATEGEFVAMLISDTGEGMSEDIRSKIFEPFFTTKDEGKGTGLGLATVYGIIKQSGGYIWLTVLREWERHSQFTCLK